MKTFEEKMRPIAKHIVLRCKELNKNLEWCNSLIIHYVGNESEAKEFQKLIFEEYNKLSK